MKHKFELEVRKRFLTVLFVILVIIFAIFQGLYDWHVHQVNDFNDQAFFGQPLIVSLLDNAVNNLNAPAPVDAQTGQVYFPDVHLQLPAPSQNYALRKIEYANTSSDGSFSLQVTSEGIISEAENKLLVAQANAQAAHKNYQNVLMAIYRQVPNLQACTRGVQLFYNAQNQTGSDYKLQFTKKLNNSKTLYAYTETTCVSQDLPTLINYLKQIQGY
jgi:hypothetical protein